jgi:signal peptidase II
MVIGGAIGNIIDRLHLGAVADFLDFHAFGWHYPSFNAADSFITVGIVMLVANSLFCSGHKEAI